MKTMTVRNQEAFDYAVYMIAGSYFNKAICDYSKYQENKLLLYYKEEKRDVQYMMEETAIIFMEKYLTKVLPESIWEEDVVVDILRNEEKGRSIIRFLGMDFTMELEVQRRRKKVLFYGSFKGVGKKLRWKVGVVR